MTARSELQYSLSIEATLQKLYGQAPRIPIGLADRVVIMSDLHLGDGGPRDDFRQNAALVQKVLRGHYLPGGYSLVLNGDIEELQRFSYAKIRAHWQPLMGLFQEFHHRGALYRILGNHDQALRTVAEKELSEILLDAVCFTIGPDTIFVFHGHQATIFFERFNGVAGFFLRHVANTLQIHNMPGVFESRKKYLTEHRVYAFSSSRKVVSIIGHTHRPLFESLSKIDTLRFRIEQLCRDYPSVSPRARAAIETVIAAYRLELARVWEKDRVNGLRSSLYNEQISIPCLFNSGCGIGKRGVTALEIADGEIALVHWFDRTRGERHMKEEGRPAERLAGTDYYRSILKQDKLQYVFTRIRLLT
jgi:predicted phosphodiesterase